MPASSVRHLGPSEAAARLGVSTKALRLYEHHGLLAPTRSFSRWRAYGPDEMVRAKEIVALRALGLSLSEIGRALSGGAGERESALTRHQHMLEGKVRDLAEVAARLHELRTGPASGSKPAERLKIAFDLPWPWGGERFELTDIRAINFIVGPLGSGKTRLARHIAESVPDGLFLGLDRSEGEGGAIRARLDRDPALRAGVDRALSALVEDGATVTDALSILLAAMLVDGPTLLVVDMVEQGLDHASQQALIAWLRRHPPRCPLFLMTRSSAILDLASVGRDETILYCPANHGPPLHVAPVAGAPGHEAVATALAPPDVRARTEGMFAMRLAPA